MANTKKNTSKSTSSKKTTTATKKVEPKVVEEPVVAITESKPKEIDLNQYIPVYNGFHGRLIYKSRRTNEKFVWSTYGDVQEIELKELKNAKSTAKNFFINNWFMFDDEYLWVIDYLGVGLFYENSVGLNNYDEIFKLNHEQIRSKVSKMSKAQKDNLKYRAIEMIRTGDLDSHKLIKTLEELLGVQLIEK